MSWYIDPDGIGADGRCDHCHGECRCNPEVHGRGYLYVLGSVLAGSAVGLGLGVALLRVLS